MDPSRGSAAPDARVRAEVAEFLASPHAAPFVADRTGTGDVARAFLEACYGDLAVRPDLLDEEQLREALLDLLPSRLEPGASASARAIPIVRALLEWRFETRPNANAWKFANVLETAEEEFPARLQERGGRDVKVDSRPITRPGSKLGRNDPCPCGSGKKWKKCCGKSG